MSAPKLLQQTIYGAFNFLKPALERLDPFDVEIIRIQAETAAEAGNRAEVMAALSRLDQLIDEAAPAEHSKSAPVDDEVDPFPSEDDAEWVARLGDEPQAGKSKAKVKEEGSKQAEEKTNQVKPITLLAPGFIKWSREGVIISPLGTKYCDPLLGLNAEERKALKGTPFDAFGGTGSLFIDTEFEQEPGWHVDQMIAEGIIGVIGGAGSVGKSFYAAQMALCKAGGLPFLGNSTGKPGRVLYINTEDPRVQNQRRLRRLLNGLCRQATRNDPEEMTPHRVEMLRANILGNLTYINMCDDAAWSEYSPELVDENGNGTPFYFALKKFCSVFKPDLVILDPLIYFLANENDNIEAKRLYNMIKRLSVPKTSFICPHHMNKSSLSNDSKGASDANRQTQARGAGHLVMGAKYFAILEKSDTGIGHQLNVPKHNFAEQIVEPIQIALDRGYDHKTSQAWLLWKSQAEMLNELAEKAEAPADEKDQLNPDFSELIKTGAADLGLTGQLNQTQQRQALERGREIVRRSQMPDLLLQRGRSLCRARIPA